MRLALIGASGYIGSALRKEALLRGHHVTALVTHPEKLHRAPNLNIVKCDVMNTDALAEALENQDIVISAFSGHAQAEVQAYYERGIHSIINAAKIAGVPRLLVVGGAGSLEVGSGKQLLDTPEFPAAYRATAEGARSALTLLRAERELDWSILSPSANLAPGERTAQFRLGGDRLLVDRSGRSHISVEDYAVAMLDEVDQPKHHRQRFTVGY